MTAQVFEEDIYNYCKTCKLFTTSPCHHWRGTESDLGQHSRSCFCEICGDVPFAYSCESWGTSAQDGCLQCGNYECIWEHTDRYCGICNVIFCKQCIDNH